MRKILFLLISLIPAVPAIADTDSATPQNQQQEVAYYPPSRWGSPPAKVTKELVYRQYPHLRDYDEKKEEEKQDLSDSSEECGN